MPRSLTARSIRITVFPPKADEADALLHDALETLRDLSPSFVSVTYGAGGSSRDRTTKVVRSLRDPSST